MILTAITIILVSSVAYADNDCSVCDNMQFSASGGLEIEYSRYMGEWFKTSTYEGRPVYMCPGIDCQGLDNVMAWIDNQGRLPPSPCTFYLRKCYEMVRVPASIGGHRYTQLC